MWRGRGNGVGGKSSVASRASERGRTNLIPGSARAHTYLGQPGGYTPPAVDRGLRETGG
jgi:hypothetical protein